MSANAGADDREQIKQLREQWDEYDTTGDVDLIMDILAEDVVFLPPGESPVVGKDHCLEWMAPHEPPDHDLEPEQVSEEVIISGDLAVDRGGMIVRDPTADDSIVSIQKDIDVYQRDEEGEWKYLIWIGLTPL